jgi:hypothetical protein
VEVFEAVTGNGRLLKEAFHEYAAVAKGFCRG